MSSNMEKLQSTQPTSTQTDSNRSKSSANSSRNKTTPNKRERFIAGAAGLVIIVSIAAGFLGGWLGSSSRTQQTTAKGITATQKAIAENQSQLISTIAKNVSPSVVSVDVTSQAQTDTQNSFFGFTTPTTQQRSAGTGIIISSDGYIVTNRHVVPAGSTSVSITLSDGTRLTNVAVVGRTADSDPLDIAFLKINDKKGKTLIPAVLGNSSKIQVGDLVVAIGNALGQFQNTVTSGIISGFGRSVQAGDQSGTTSESLQDLFQTDAAINEGNSGGPLLNDNGDVIGINTALAGGAQNIGFAIPINNVTGLIKSVLKQGKLLRPYLGIRYVSLTPDYAYQFNISTQQGAYITSGQAGQAAVVAGSPADKAGLQEKDIITKVNGLAIDANHSLASLLGGHSVGDTVNLTILRNGKEQTVSVTLQAEPTQ